jgi:hypothetical protein
MSIVYLVSMVVARTKCIRPFAGPVDLTRKRRQMRVFREFFTIGRNEHGPLAHSGESDQPVGTLFASGFAQENVIDRMDSIREGLRVKFHTLPGMRTQAHGRSLLPAVRGVVLLYGLSGRRQSPAPLFKPTTGKPAETGRCDCRASDGTSARPEIVFKGLRLAFCAPRAGRWEGSLH